MRVVVETKKRRAPVFTGHLIEFTGYGSDLYHMISSFRHCDESGIIEALPWLYSLLYMAIPWLISAPAVTLWFHISLRVSHDLRCCSIHKPQNMLLLLDRWSYRGTDIGYKKSLEL